MGGQTNSGSLKYLIKITVLWAVLLAAVWILIWKTHPLDKPVWWITISDYVGIISGMITGTFAIVAALCMFLGHNELVRLLRRLNRSLGRTEFINTGDSFNCDDVKAVIIPVSRYEQPAWIINHLKPEKVALVCTEVSKSIGEKLIDDFTEARFINSLGALQNNEALALLQNPEDPSESRKMTKQFIKDFAELGYLRSEIFVDTTGGMVPMSIGCFQGAEEEGISSIYISGTVKAANGMIVKNPANKQDGKAVFINDRSKIISSEERFNGGK